MRELFTAIYSKLSGSAFEVSATGLYLYQAPQERAMPYAVYQLISNVPEYTFTSIHEEILIQFNLFSDSTTDEQVSDMYSDLKALYDDCDLTITGYRHVRMVRDLAILTKEDEETWKYTVQYRVLIEKE